MIPMLTPHIHYKSVRTKIKETKSKLVPTYTIRTITFQYEM